MSYIVQGRNKLAPKCAEDLVLINERTSLLIKSPSRLFEFSVNLGSYLTGQLVANASMVYFAKLSKTGMKVRKMIKLQHF